MSADIWQAVVNVPPLLVPAFEDALGTEALACSSFETTPGGPWLIKMLLQGPVDKAALEMRLALVAASWDIAAPHLNLTLVPETDWVTASYQALPPVRAGRFFVHGAHDRGTAPGGTIAWVGTLMHCPVRSKVSP